MTAEDHCRTLGIEPADVPETLVLIGMFDVAAGLARFSGYLDEPRTLKRIPTVLARKGGQRVVLATCFGGPMAAHHAHIWCAAGVRRVIQFGWFGALQPGSANGDVVVPGHAERQDGVSDWYLPKGILADATPALASAIAAEVRASGVAAAERPIFSTPALLAESREIIADWSRHGWYGVDMETAATFAVAKSFGVERAAALIRIDDLISEEDSVAGDFTRDQVAAMRERERVVFDAVLRATASHQ